MNPKNLKAITLAALVALTNLIPQASFSAINFVSTGSGGYLCTPPQGARTPQTEIYKSENLKKRLPTNKWWSSLAWDRFSNNMYPHPLAVRATPQGLRIYYPGNNISASANAIIGGMPGGNADFTVGLSAVDQFESAVVDDFGDWSVSALFKTNNTSIRANIAMGSPFVTFEFNGDSPVFRFSTQPKIIAGDENTSMLVVALGNRYYAFFSPGSSKWNGIGSTNLKMDSNKKNYFSIAVLPDSLPETLELFQKHAHVHITNTVVQWEFDENKSIVKTKYIFQTKKFEGEDDAVIFALYPHQWLNTKTKLTDKIYNSVRGPMKIAVGREFTTETVFPGVLPVLPVVKNSDTNLLFKFLEAEVKKQPRLVGDTYWLGKQLGKLTSLTQISEQTGQIEWKNTFAERIKKSLENFFTPTNQSGMAKTSREGVFYYDTNWGTLIGYPASYGSDDQLNDHHFHYGYFIRAAAEIARQDSQWAKDELWGGMVKTLIRDIANPDRSDIMFPFLRNLDVYAGHSWASGTARFADGNNNESSSEAVNAWYGIILFGAATKDKKLRDLGIFLLTTEIEAINHYWFDVTAQFHHTNYRASVVTMVWGGKGVNETWFSNNPEMVHGINFLPLTPCSLYLGRHPDYCAKNYQALVSEKRKFIERRGKNIDQQTKDSDIWEAWTDITLMYRALSDPQDAMKQFNERLNNLNPEAGNSMANVYAWISMLNEYGTIEKTISANHPYYAVFRKGNALTYTAYNFDSQQRLVRFSNGYELLVPPKSLAIKSR
ncbi:MAG: glycosyl hydrolase [Verrucomicrobiae bacterium]|nr:glycosyl hydrolase [Verrucomicrobiae bacterium]